jgi:hypothetical protein
MIDRFSKILNLEQYSVINKPLYVGAPPFNPPQEEQRILRMLVNSPYSGFKIPEYLNWTLPIIRMAEDYQLNTIKIKHPFTYVTVRHGIVNTKTDCHWHVDGFSVRYNHLPEANYLITSNNGTDIANQTFYFPNDFDPLKHNVHPFFAKMVEENNVMHLDTNSLYFLDPYVVHRRPPTTYGAFRSTVRVSFTPIEIPDINNTRNPLIETHHYTVDGIKSWRNNLKDYHLRG